MRFWKFIGYTVLTVIILAFIGAGVAYYLMWASLPVTEGELKTKVVAEVEIYRNDYGVPHLFATDVDDLFFAQGYVHAQDRLWQMDITHRGTSGKISEIIGDDMLETDIFALTVGFRRAAEKSLEAVSPETRAMLEAYARGVNTYIEDNKGSLPPEFALLGYKPESWEPVDSICIAKYMAWYLGANMDSELFLSAVIAQVGEEKAAEIFPYYPDFGPSIMDQAKELDFTSADIPALNALAELGTFGSPPAYIPGVGSNNWVAGGDITESGNAMLANDMHVLMGAPSMSYTQYLSLEEDFKVTGITLPGIPGVVVGYNEHIGWGITNVNADVQDLYRMRFHDDEPYLYEYMGEWQEAEVLEKEIFVKGWEDPYSLEVMVTRHGPVISDVVDLDEPLCLRWVSHEATNEPDAILAFARAQNWEDFQEALQNYQAPALNFVYADKEGNIGLRSNGLIPIRRNGDGLLPLPGWTDEYEWEGFVPWDELPQFYNPPSGLIVTANEQVADDDYPYHISHEWSPPYRALSIHRELEEKKEITLDDMKGPQASFYSKQAELLLPVIIKALEGNNFDAEEAEAFSFLREWKENPVEEAHLGAPLVFHYLYLKMTENIFGDELGDELLEKMGNYRPFVNIMDRKLLTGESSWFNNINTPEVETRNDIIIQSFCETVEELMEMTGAGPSDWRWGDLHTITFEHLMGEVPGISFIFNRGPYPVGGGPMTPANMSYDPGDPFPVILSAPWRFVVDMGNKAGYDVLGPGVSGHPLSHHYDDQVEMWLNMEYKPFLFDPAEIFTLEELLIMIPENR